MKVAIIGAKGYPYVYGGYDTFVKELAERLIQKNIRVTVYNHKKLFNSFPETVNGIQVKYINAIETKSLSQLTHSFKSILHACFSDADIILVVNAANGPFGLLTKLFRKKTIINVDGIEWLRPKWKGMGSKYFLFAAWCATKLYDRIITDAVAMQKVYQEKFNAVSTVIAYGANKTVLANTIVLERLNITHQQYYLVIGRLIPDNNADIIVQGFIQSNSQKKLLIVGDVSYKDAYADAIKNIQHPNLVFAGYVNDADELSDLYHHCYCYIHGHEFGGTNPTLIQALASNCAILALNTGFSREMLSDNEYGLYFEKNVDSIADQINYLDANEGLAQQLRDQSAKAITEKYNWDCITEKYINVMKELLSSNKKA